MVRVIKRYESRKLYDTEESRYVSVEEIAAWVRDGQEVQVLDNATSDDITAQVLTQIILDEGRNGSSKIPTELLHELVRFGGRAISTGVEQVQHSVDRFFRSSIDRLSPVREAREEMSVLRERLERLEASLSDLDGEPAVKASGAGTKKKVAKKTRKTAKKVARKTSRTRRSKKTTRKRSN